MNTLIFQQSHVSLAYLKSLLPLMVNFISMYEDIEGRIYLNVSFSVGVVLNLIKCVGTI